jgi:hypothetical protein
MNVEWVGQSASNIRKGIKEVEFLSHVIRPLSLSKGKGWRGAEILLYVPFLLMGSVAIRSHK